MALTCAGSVLPSKTDPAAPYVSNEMVVPGEMADLGTDALTIPVNPYPAFGARG